MHELIVQRPAIVGTWTLPLAVYQVLLSARVSQQRLATNTMIGSTSSNSSNPPSSGRDERADPLTVATRAHGNFLENVPLAVLLAAVVELNGGDKRVLNGTLAALLAFRLTHAELGLRAAEDGTANGRIIGHTGSQVIILGLAGYATWLIRGYWGF